MYDYDLLVIGTGGGGMAAAIRGAELGARVAIVEAGTIGGTCVNRGCVPSKTLMRAALVYHQAGHHGFAGVHTRQEGVDWPKLIAQKEALIEGLRQEKYLDVLAAYDRITLLRGWARLQGEGRVAVSERLYRAQYVVLATGARPHILPLEGIETVEVLTSTTAMTLPQQPRSLLVIGGRAVALELGQIFARLGTRVTLLQRSPRLLPEHEPVIAEAPGRLPAARRTGGAHRGAPPGHSPGRQRKSGAGRRQRPTAAFSCRAGAHGHRAGAQHPGPGAGDAGHCQA
ncbi:MAG: hypothetical protein KatS3mg131_2644 [Candidatus Tectimicrobiota bacterium]|nr:MAG: hypothetical protein KatS3mg131_2644 [Candidatus Tectomicrobia bacterium]